MDTLTDLLEVWTLTLNNLSLIFEEKLDPLTESEGKGYDGNPRFSKKYTYNSNLLFFLVSYLIGSNVLLSPLNP